MARTRLVFTLSRESLFSSRVGIQLVQESGRREQRALLHHISCRPRTNSPILTRTLSPKKRKPRHGAPQRGWKRTPDLKLLAVLAEQCLHSIGEIVARHETDHPQVRNFRAIRAQEHNGW